MAQSEFWQMTPREFTNACEGYNEKNDRNFKIGWEQARWIVTYVVNVNSPKKQYKPEEIAKFPWESDSTDMADEIEKIKEMRQWREQERH